MEISKLRKSTFANETANKTTGALPVIQRRRDGLPVRVFRPAAFTLMSSLLLALCRRNPFRRMLFDRMGYGTHITRPGTKSLGASVGLEISSNAGDTPIVCVSVYRFSPCSMI